MGYVVSVNISDGGVPKLPVARARVTVLGLEGDRQRTPVIHGGPLRAVCLFSAEVIERLQAEGHPIRPGAAGENLTLAGLRWEALGPGSRLRIGEAVELEVTSFTVPCSTIAGAFVDRNAYRIAHQRHPGESRLYARVLTEGEVRTGDPVTVTEQTR